MSKERGLVESAAEASFVPTAPPSYDEAMMQAGVSYPSAPMASSHPMAAQPVPMPMPMPMPMPQPQPQQHSLPMSNYYPAQVASPVPPAVYSPPMLASAQAPTTVIFTSLGRDRSLAMCPECNAQVMTETLEKNKCLAHFFCCCLLFSCPCCSCLPYCMDSCKIVEHSCPNCGAHLGTYRPA